MCIPVHSTCSFTRSGLFKGAFFGALYSVDLLVTVDDGVEETGKETVYSDTSANEDNSFQNHIC